MVPLHAAKARKEKEPREVQASAGKALGAPANASDFEAFRLIVDRNIFNPNRTPRSRGGEVVAPRVETLALVGTMESERGRQAFFDSADAALRQPVREGDTIAGFTVGTITANSVQLTAGEKTLTVRVNQQLRRTEGGEWRLGARDVLRAEVARVDDATEKEKKAMAIPTDASDVLRRMMERRQKQLKQ